MSRDSAKTTKSFILFKAFVLLALIIVWITPIGSDSGSTSIVFTDIPKWGQEGQLKGVVYGANVSQARLYVFEFLPDLGWYAKPNCSAVPIQGTGEFSVVLDANLIDRNATRYSAYLLPASVGIPCVDSAEALPFAVTRADVRLATASVPRLPGYKTITFSGLDWYVKSAPVKVYPGPQSFTEDQVSVDAQGRLHLKLGRCLNSTEWCAAEVFTTQRVGYGNYRFTTESPLNALDQNTTLGLFTWDEQEAAKFHQEWDIEFSRWGDPNASFNSQYVVQPYNVSGNMVRFLTSPASQTTHTVTWNPTQVGFISSVGSGGGSLISQFTYAPTPPGPIPAPGDVRLHLNYYVAVGQAPSVPVDREVIISSVQYTPFNPQVGLSRTGDSVSFVASSYQIPLTAGSSTCVATVESDSPWLTITGSSSIAGSGALQYSVSNNLGTARTGNLILRSSNCTPTLGRQVFSVNQAGFVCDPDFTSPSTHVGFIGAVRSVGVRALSSACSWSVSSSAPWLKIVAGSSGAGDGNPQFSVDTNSDQSLRPAWLQLNNGRLHFVYQDAAAALFALSPSAVTSCGETTAQFGVSWSAPGSVEIHTTSATGPLIGQFGASGSALLPKLADGVILYLIQVGGPGSPRSLATARTSVLSDHCGDPAISALGISNAASSSPFAIAPDGLATIKGVGLASTIAQSDAPYPERLGGIEVLISGIKCPISYVSPGQINFLVPAGIPPGRHLITVGSASAEVDVLATAPGIFTLSGDGTGTAIAATVAVFSDGTSRGYLPIYQCGGSGCVPSPIDLPPNLAELYVILYTTGVRNLKTASALIGSLVPDIVFAGPISVYPGVDIVSLKLTRFSGLSGRQSVRLKVDGLDSNAVDVAFR